MKKILPFAAALLVVVSLFGCGEPDFDGSRLGNDSQLVMEYKTLNGTDSQQLELEEGDREILRQMEVEIRQLIGEEACPPALSKGKCGACSYYEFCYSGEGE